MATEPLLISVAPNGARRSRSDHVALPISPAQLADAAVRCEEAGARLFHLHVRNAEGGHSLSADHYREAITAIRAAVSDRIVIQATTEACGIYSIDAQIDAIRTLRPEAASFALREFLPDPAEEQRYADFFGWVAEAGILAQHILYSTDEARRLGDLLDRGILPPGRPSVLFVLGRYADGIVSDPVGLFPFIEAWGDRGPWSVCAFGPSEIRVAAAAAALGGHVRVGFENNLQRPDGSVLESNAEQVRNVAALAASMGRPLIDISAARLLGRSPHGARVHPLGSHACS